VPTRDVLFIGACAALAVIAWGLAGAVRPRLSKDARAAPALLAPTVVLLPAMLVAAGTGVLLALAPLASAIAMCAAAAWVLHPTAATRFAHFERQFWAHVGRTEQQHSVR